MERDRNHTELGLGALRSPCPRTPRPSFPPIEDIRSSQSNSDSPEGDEAEIVLSFAWLSFAVVAIAMYPTYSEEGSVMYFFWPVILSSIL